MMQIKRNVTTAILVAAAAATVLTGCSDESDTVSENLSTAADNFEVNRRVVFFNGITDTYLLTIEGLCSVTDEGNQLEVTCKVGDDAYKKHFLGLSDNVSYFVEQLDAVDVDAYHYRVIFRPETIVPDIDLETSDGNGN
jgi:hypothetical protein